jgi:hypothetical protein
MGSDPELRKLRKYESILVLSGFGVMIFGLWSIIRAAIYYILYPFDVAEFLGKSEYAQIMAEGREEGVEFITENLGTIIMVVLFTVLAIDLLLRIYVGMSARAYGRGRKKRGFFIFVAWVMAVFALFGIVMSVQNFVQPVIDAFKDSSANAYAETGATGEQAGSVSIFVDITSFLVLLELAISAMQVRKLRKQLGIKTRKDTAEDYYDDMAEISESLTGMEGLSSLNISSVDRVSSKDTGDK